MTVCMNLMLGEAIWRLCKSTVVSLRQNCWVLETVSALQQEVLDIARQLVVDLGTHSDCEIEERKSKLEQLKSVLEM